MSTKQPHPDEALDALRAALAQLRDLAAAHAADSFYASAAEQVAAVVAGLESRATPGQTFGIPLPPNPGALPEDPR